MVKWEERIPKHGEICRIMWSDWYAKMIKEEYCVGIFNNMKGAIFSVTRNAYVRLVDYANVEVLEINL